MRVCGEDESVMGSSLGRGEFKHPPLERKRVYICVPRTWPQIFLASCSLTFRRFPDSGSMVFYPIGHFDHDSSGPSPRGSPAADCVHLFLDCEIVPDELFPHGTTVGLTTTDGVRAGMVRFSVRLLGHFYDW
jgi:hypothetical protein